MGNNNVRTTIALKNTTKMRLDRNRAPGQCYEGFLCQLMDHWENTRLRTGNQVIPRNRRSA